MAGPSVTTGRATLPSNLKAIYVHDNTAICWHMNGMFQRAGRTQQAAKCREYLHRFEAALPGIINLSV